MKNKSIKKILIFYFIFFFCLLFNPHFSMNVMAIPNTATFDFEDDAVNGPYDDINNGTTMTTTWDDGKFEVESTRRSGLRGFLVGDLTKYNFWNYTYAHSILSNWSTYLYRGAGGTIFHFGFYNKTQYDNGDTAINDAFIHIWVNGQTWKYMDHNNAYQTIGSRTSDAVWDMFSINFDSNNSVDYHLAGYNSITNVPPQNNSFNNSFMRIDVLRFNQANDDDFFFDDHSFVTDVFFISQYGNMTINVFNESDVETAIPNYDVHILNKIGGLMYSVTNQSNPTVINNANFGSGYRFFLIEHDDYSSRMFGAIFDAEFDYSLNVLLAPVNDSLLYYVKVIDQLETPIYNASIEIVKTVNGTVYNIGGLLTDTFGFAGIYLLGDETYWVNVSKEGYNSINGARWDTDSDNYGIDNPKIFQLSLYAVDDIIYYDFYTHIVFTGVMQDNNSILITYRDRLELTDDTQIKTFETYNGTDTLVNITNTTDNDNFNFYIESINTTRIHYADLYFNHSYNFSVDQPVRIFIYPINYTGIPHTNATNLEDAITAVFGVNPLGWGNSIAVAIALILLVSFGPYNAPMGVICCGLGLAIPKLAFAINNPLLFALIPVIVIIGIIYVIVKNPEVNM